LQELDNNNNNGFITLESIYKLIEDNVNNRFKKKGLRYKFNYRMLTKAVGNYFRDVLFRVIENNEDVKLVSKLGTFSLSKVLCTKYNPTKFFTYRKDGKLITKKMKFDVNKTDGYFYYIYWNRVKAYRRCKIRFSRRWKRMIYKEMVLNFGDCVDNTKYIKYNERCNNKRAKEKIRNLQKVS
tara:strand:+ start:2958 stop:3503 length:546 start_codon:yes stop_codon:yes gene_type:complete